MSIVFGDRNANFAFSDPIAWSRWLIKLKEGGVYAILVPDQHGDPKPFRPIYFGKAASFAERVSTSHENYKSWCGTCLQGQQLFISLLPVANEAKRIDIESRLIEAYQPVCNTTGIDPYVKMIRALHAK